MSVMAFAERTLNELGILEECEPVRTVELGPGNATVINPEDESSYVQYSTNLHANISISSRRESTPSHASGIHLSGKSHRG
jgi:hypothetical protein